MSRYELFDRRQIALKDLAERGHDLHAADCKPLAASFQKYAHPEFGELVGHIVQARRQQRPVILMMGGHAIKLGLSRYLIDLIERGLVTHLATNGAGIIHDFELAAGGGTSENVAKWIERGQFGLWRETSRLNDIIFAAANRGEGLGEAVGRVIEEERLPFRHLSIAAAGWRTGVPVTSHVGIGSDIIHAHANCDGAALGAASYTDFLIFAQSVAQLEGGVFLNVGSAVTGPEVYLKALSMARNVAAQRGASGSATSRPPCSTWSSCRPTSARDRRRRIIRNTTTGRGRRSSCAPWPTAGEATTFRGDLSSTIPTLWHEVGGAQFGRRVAGGLENLPARNRCTNPIAISAAVFLDRDGTLNRDVGFVHRVEDLRTAGRTSCRDWRAWRPWAFSCSSPPISRASAAATSPKPTCTRSTEALVPAAARRKGSRSPAVYFCPFHPTEGSAQYRRDSPLRKPRPGMIREAAASTISICRPALPSATRCRTSWPARRPAAGRSWSRGAAERRAGRIDRPARLRRRPTCVEAAGCIERAASAARRQFANAVRPDCVRQGAIVPLSREGFALKIGVFIPNWIGDAAMCTPTLRALRRHFGRGAQMRRHPAALRGRRAGRHALARRADLLSIADRRIRPMRNSACRASAARGEARHDRAADQFVSQRGDGLVERSAGSASATSATVAVRC